jgi:hypothetical protein
MGSWGVVGVILIVTGTRDAPRDKAKAIISEYLDRYKFQSHPIAVFHGNSGNVDLAVTDLMPRYDSKASAGSQGGLSHLPFNANWKEHGKSAGPRRNQDMINFSQLYKQGYAGSEAVKGLAVWDGKSKGTKDCIDRMKKAGIEVEVIRV